MPELPGGYDCGQERIAKGGSHITNTAHGILEYADEERGYPALVILGRGGGFDQGVAISKIFLNEIDFPMIALQDSVSCIRHCQLMVINTLHPHLPHRWMHTRIC